MPGQIVVDQQSTFTSPPIAMSTAPRLKFGTDTQEVTREGERRWVVTAAVTYRPQYGRQVSEVIDVALNGQDPAEVIQPGMQVEFASLACGISAPEVNGETGRVRGGKLFWSCSGVRPLGAKAAAA